MLDKRLLSLVSSLFLLSFPFTLKASFHSKSHRQKCVTKHSVPRMKQFLTFGIRRRQLLWDLQLLCRLYLLDRQILLCATGHTGIQPWSSFWGGMTGTALAVSATLYNWLCTCSHQTNARNESLLEHSCQKVAISHISKEPTWLERKEIYLPHRLILKLTNTKEQCLKN